MGWATHGSAPPTATLLAGTTNGIRGQLGAAAATPPKEGASAHMQQTDTPPKEGASALHIKLGKSNANLIRI